MNKKVKEKNTGFVKSPFLLAEEKRRIEIQKRLEKEIRRLRALRKA